MMSHVPAHQMIELKYLMPIQNHELLNDPRGLQWLSGRVLDSRPRGHRFQPNQRHCIVSLSKNINPSLVLIQTRKTRPFITERLLMGCKESNETKSMILGNNGYS